MITRSVAAGFLILAGSVFPAFGQGRNAPRNSLSIEGTVRDDADHHAMENVRVDLLESSGIPINTTFTRGNGEFEFAALGVGDYIIEVNLKDYDPFRQTVTLYSNGLRSVSIFLTRPVVVKQTNSSASISAHELKVPRKAHDEYEKGLQLFYSKSDYRGAIVQFQHAIKDYPDFYEAYAQEGNAYLRLKELAPAEEAMRKSVELSSGHYSEAIFMLAALLNDTSRYADAAASARQGMEVDPGSWRGPYELARALLAMQQLDEAEKAAIQARDLKPDNPPVYLMLANIDIHRQDYPALQSDLEGYLKLVPTGPEADQARQTRDEIIAARQQAENQAQAAAQEKSRAEAQTAPPRNVPPPAPEPDSSGLPPLPALSQDNP